MTKPSQSPDTASAPSPSGSGIRLGNAGFAVNGKIILDGITADLTERRIGIIGRNGS